MEILSDMLSVEIKPSKLSACMLIKTTTTLTQLSIQAAPIKCVGSYKARLLLSTMGNQQKVV